MPCLLQWFNHKPYKITDAEDEALWDILKPIKKHNKKTGNAKESLIIEDQIKNRLTEGFTSVLGVQTLTTLSHEKGKRIHQTKDAH